jgi:hypothetical protein
MTTLLIDADILAYRVAAIHEQAFDFGDGGTAVKLSPERLKEDIEIILDDLLVELAADQYRICLSDPYRNWRKELDPTYKANRKGSVKPQMLDDTKRYLYQEKASFVLPRLEADDVMGILATSPNASENFIIVSEDKDMRTIPGRVFHPNRPENGVMNITVEEANRFLLYQTIVGDPTDGYPGAPGVGKLSPYVTALQDADDPLDMWDCVLDAFASVSLTEADAIHQARLACICRHTNWNRETQKVRLWSPLHLLF